MKILNFILNKLNLLWKEMQRIDHEFCNLGKFPNKYSPINLDYLFEILSKGNKDFFESLGWEMSSKVLNDEWGSYFHPGETEEDRKYKWICTVTITKPNGFKIESTENSLMRGYETFKEVKIFMCDKLIYFNNNEWYENFPQESIDFVKGEIDLLFTAWHKIREKDRIWKEKIKQDKKDKERNEFLKIVEER